MCIQLIRFGCKTKCVPERRKCSKASLTAYVANVNPALTSHVLNNIKICYLKVRRADADFTPMSPMRRRYYVQSLQKSNTLPCKLSMLRKIDCFILFPIEPEHEIKLRGAPYELVPGYFVNILLVLTTDVIREGSGEHVR